MSISETKKNVCYANNRLPVCVHFTNTQTVYSLLHVYSALSCTVIYSILQLQLWEFEITVLLHMSTNMTLK